MMIGLVIKFVGKDRGETAFPALARENCVHLADGAPPIEVAALEGGMSSGQPSIALRIDLPDGKSVIAETSARLFCGAARAFMARYPNLFDDDIKRAQAPSSFKGKKNIYTCRNCAGHIVTVDVDDGTTPFLVGCEATKGCDGTMQSSMYRVFDQNVKAGWEWYKPSDLRGLTSGELEHVTMGGLLLRKASA